MCIYVFTEGDLCSSNPCFHGGICSVTEEDDYICDCEGTGYTGRSCETGVLSIPELPLLSVGTLHTIEVEAHPDSELTVEFKSPQLEPMPSRITLNKGNPVAMVTLNPKSAGFHTMSLELGGKEEDLYKKPVPLLAVVKPSGAPSQYFSARELDTGIIDEGCCAGISTITCPAKSNSIRFLSTCKWSRAKTKDDRSAEHTPGIVFSSGNGLILPVSIDGATIVKSSSMINVQANTFGNVECKRCPELLTGTCKEYGSPDKCYCLSPSNADKVAFLELEALGNTFFRNTAILLPSWLSFRANATDRLYSSDSQLTLLSQEGITGVEKCKGFIEEYSTKIPYSILIYSGALQITINDTHGLHSPGEDPYCFAVDLCEGNRSALHVSIPRNAQFTLADLPLVKEFLLRGWEVTWHGISMAKIEPFSNVFGDHSTVISGILSTGVLLSDVQISLLLDGFAGLNIASLQNVSKKEFMLPKLSIYIYKKVL